LAADRSLGQFGIRACRLAFCSPRPAAKVSPSPGSGALGRLAPPAGPAGGDGPGSTLGSPAGVRPRRVARRGKAWHGGARFGQQWQGGAPARPGGDSLTGPRVRPGFWPFRGQVDHRGCGAAGHRSRSMPAGVSGPASEAGLTVSCGCPVVGSGGGPCRGWRPGASQPGRRSSQAGGPARPAVRLR